MTQGTPVSRSATADGSSALYSRTYKRCTVLPEETSTPLQSRMNAFEMKTNALQMETNALQMTMNAFKITIKTSILTTNTFAA